MGVVNLSSIDAQCFQKGNPGGINKLYTVISRQIAGEWPQEKDIDENGYVKNLPVLLPTITKGINGGANVSTPTKWAQYVLPNNTCDVGSDSNGSNAYGSYNHAINLALAGYAKASKEARKHLNAGSVWIAKMKGGEYVVVGSSDDPVFLKSSFKSGVQAGDKRGYTFKGVADGLTFDMPMVSDAMMATLEIESVPVEL